MHRMGRRRRRSLAESEERLDRFESGFARFAGAVEALLSRVIALGLAGLVVIQTLALIPGLRRATNLVEAYEGIPAGEVAAWSGAAVPAEPTAITVSLVGQSSAPKAWLLVDGRKVDDFGKGQVTAKLRPGQKVEIDGSLARRSLTFKVTGSTGLASPQAGMIVSTTKNRQPLGTAR